MIGIFLANKGTICKKGQINCYTVEFWFDQSVWEIAFEEKPPDAFLHMTLELVLPSSLIQGQSLVKKKSS